jgi:transketolase
MKAFFTLLILISVSTQLHAQSNEEMIESDAFLSKIAHSPYGSNDTINMVRAMRDNGMSDEAILKELPNVIKRQDSQRKAHQQVKEAYNVYFANCQYKFPEMEKSFQQRLHGQDFDSKKVIDDTKANVSQIRDCLNAASELSKLETAAPNGSSEGEALRTSVRDLFTALNDYESKHSGILGTARTAIEYIRPTATR